MSGNRYMDYKFSENFEQDYYTGIKGIYFFKILKTIIKIGDLRNKQVKILDFGSGTGQLKRLLPEKVVGFDINRGLTEINDWKSINFDVVVANQVFYLFSKDELLRFLDELYAKNPKVNLIVGISTQGLLNKILSILANQKDAHSGTKLTPKEEINALKQRMHIIKKQGVLFMCDVFLLKFKV